MIAMSSSTFAMSQRESRCFVPKGALRDSAVGASSTVESALASSLHLISSPALFYH